MKKTVVVLVLAAIWSVGLIVAAAFAPAYSSTSATVSSSSSGTSGLPTTIDQAEVSTTDSSTLVEENGPRVLVLVAIPLVIVASVSLALWGRRKRGRRGAGAAAWTATGLLGAFAFVSILSIGFFIIPVFVLLITACTFEATRTDPSPTPPSFSPTISPS